MEKLIAIFSQYPNFFATMFGVCAAGFSAFFGFLLKRPLQRQTLATELFKAQIEGFESIVKAQSNRIVFLESQESIHVAHAADLWERLQKCERRNHEKVSAH